jgi:hypothetical protein
VVGHLAAAVDLHHRDIAGRDQVLAARVQSQREHGGCSTNQISSRVDGCRSSVKRCIARQVGSYGAQPQAPDQRRLGVHRLRTSAAAPVVEAGVVARERLFGAIARAHQRAGHALEKSELERPPRY